MARSAKPKSTASALTTPGVDELGLRRVVNGAGLSISLLPSGSIFAIEHVDKDRRVMLSQVRASPIADGMARLWLRLGGKDAAVTPMIGPHARLQVGAAEDRIVWEGERAHVRHRATLWLAPDEPIWFWRLEAANLGAAAIPCDAVLIQDSGSATRASS